MQMVLAGAALQARLLARAAEIQTRRLRGPSSTHRHFAVGDGIPQRGEGVGAAPHVQVQQARLAAQHASHAGVTANLQQELCRCRWMRSGFRGRHDSGRGTLSRCRSPALSLSVPPILTAASGNRTFETLGMTKIEQAQSTAGIGIWLPLPPAAAGSVLQGTSERAAATPPRGQHDVNGKLWHNRGAEQSRRRKVVVAICQRIVFGCVTPAPAEPGSLRKAEGCDLANLRGNNHPTVTRLNPRLDTAPKAGSEVM